MILSLKVSNGRFKFMVVSLFPVDTIGYLSVIILADNHNALTVISIWAPVVCVSVLLLFYYLFTPFLL